MQTKLTPEFAGTPDAETAEAILRKCVHCGFCTATCPTYQLLGDELDGPRGRIYLIKQMLEGAPVTRSTQLHLDRCLTCRSCESTCPSGVEYGKLVEIGRRLVDQRVARPLGERMARAALRTGLTSPLFKPAMKAGQVVRPLLPGALRDKIPLPVPTHHSMPTRERTRKMLMLAGCVQPAMMPNINAATIRVLDAADIQVVVAEKAGCCESDPVASRRPSWRARRHATQHRRLVAPCRVKLRRGDHHERLGLRRHREGLWIRTEGRSGLRGQGGASCGFNPRHERIAP